MKKWIHAHINTTPSYSFAVYEIEPDGDEIDSLESFEDLDEAINFAEAFSEQTGKFTHVVMVPDQDPDSDPDIAEWYQNFCPFEPYETVWDNLE